MALICPSGVTGQRAGLLQPLVTMVSAGPGLLSEMQTVHRAGRTSSAGPGLGQGGVAAAPGPTYTSPSPPRAQRWPVWFSFSASCWCFTFCPSRGFPSISSVWGSGSLGGWLPREAIISTQPGAYCPLQDQGPLTDHTAWESSWLANPWPVSHTHNMDRLVWVCAHTRSHAGTYIHVHTHPHGHIHECTHAYTQKHTCTHT